GRSPSSRPSQGERQEVRSALPDPDNYAGPGQRRAAGPGQRRAAGPRNCGFRPAGRRPCETAPGRFLAVTYNPLRAAARRAGASKPLSDHGGARRDFRRHARSRRGLGSTTKRSIKGVTTCGVKGEMELAAYFLAFVLGWLSVTIARQIYERFKRADQ